MAPFYCKLKLFFSSPTKAVISILVLTALVYFRAVFNDFASWDDDSYIMQNPYLKDFSFNGLKNIFSSVYFGMYHPLTTLTYWLEYRFFGFNPLPFHLTNVLLHLANTFLVFKLAEKLSGKTLTAIIASLLFAIHPMHVESVAWISERKDLMYSLFYIFSLYVYLLYLDSDFRKKYYLWAFLLFVASLLSKPAAITLPVLLIAIDFFKGRKITVKSFLEKLPFLLLSVFMGILTLHQRDLKELGDITVFYSFIDRIFLLSWSVAMYLIKLVVPLNLSAMYYYPETNGASLPWQYYAALPFIIAIAALLLWEKRYRRESIFALLFFLITISVMLQIVPNCPAIACERYTYIPYLGLFYFIGQRISDVTGKLQKTIVFSLFSIIVVLFSFLSYERIGVWKDGTTLFNDVIKKNPGNYHGYRMRGNIRRDKGDMAGALEDYNKMIELKPNFTVGLVNRGYIRSTLKDYAGALQDMNLALSLDSSITEAYNNRGLIYNATGDKLSALRDYNKAISLDPSCADAYNNRGNIYDSQGDTVAAMRDFSKAIELKPDFSMAYNNRSALKVKTKNFTGAEYDAGMAVIINPVYAKAYYNRGNAKALLNNFKGAKEDYDITISLDPNFSVAYFNRGVVSLNLKDTTAACKDWNTAVSLGYVGADEAILKHCK